MPEEETGNKYEVVTLERRAEYAASSYGSLSVVAALIFGFASISFSRAVDETSSDRNGGAYNESNDAYTRAYVILWAVTTVSAGLAVGSAACLSYYIRRFLAAHDKLMQLKDFMDQSGPMEVFISLSSSIAFACYMMTLVILPLSQMAEEEWVIVFAIALFGYILFLMIGTWTCHKFHRIYKKRRQHAGDAAGHEDPIADTPAAVDDTTIADTPPADTVDAAAAVAATAATVGADAAADAAKQGAADVYLQC